MFIEKIFYGNLLQTEGTHVKCVPWGRAFLSLTFETKEEFLGKLKAESSGSHIRISLGSRRACVPKAALFPADVPRYSCYSIRPPGYGVNLSEIKDHERSPSDLKALMNSEWL